MHNKITPWVFPIIWMIVIFVGSSIQLSPDESIPLGSDKIIHFVEYGILGALFFFAFFRTAKEKRYVLLIVLSTIATIGYGISDELHQYFVPTRECSIYDLIADTLGGLTFSIGISYFFRHKYN